MIFGIGTCPKLQESILSSPLGPLGVKFKNKNLKRIFFLKIQKKYPLPMETYTTIVFQ